jgi:hypothetical protein
MREQREVHLPPASEYGDALEKAWQDLAGSDLARVASNACADYDRDSRVLRLRFLGEEVRVEAGSKRVLSESGQELPSYQAILVLHYLIGAKPFGPTGNWSTFREFDSGKFYYSAFEARSIARIIDAFGSQAESLVNAATPLGAEIIMMGDAGVLFHVFPKLPVAVVVWQGDSELSPSANILFDSTAGSILTTEDLTVVAGLVTGKLVKQTREPSQEQQ